LSGGIDVAKDEMPTHARVSPDGPLEIDEPAGGQCSECRDGQRDGRDVGGETVFVDVDGSQARAVDGNAVTGVKLGAERRPNTQASPVRRILRPIDTPGSFNQSCEHRIRPADRAPTDGYGPLGAAERSWPVRPARRNRAAPASRSSG